MPRLFVAIDLPASVQDRLAAMFCGLPGARWTAPEQLHLTMRFIGEVDSSRFRDIREALGEVRGRHFFLHLEGVGFFPPRGRPRVLWAGVGKNEQLAQLYRRLEAALVGAGLEPERRKFAPHITLARLRNTPASRVGVFIAAHSLLVTADFAVNQFVLYSSVLNDRGAKHYVEEVYPLS
ncbi:2'-5'-RNA ligase [bacterium BMS3Bbin14]|nr:2'-5'-RNA ligase [bacterium BMS3Abin13]GBE52634.1 2'-5'-RNA ligase [bacterium BMS3Bbin14]